MIKKQEEPTDWVNSMVTVETPKKLKICKDPRGLNKAIKREHFPMKTIEEVVQNMPGAKVFSKLDAASGYCQLKLDDKCSKLCTFNTWTLSLPSCSIWHCLGKRDISASDVSDGRRH